MSRSDRKNRRYPAAKGRSWKRIFLVSFISLGIAMILVLVGAYFWIGSYLGSDDFRHKMEQQAARGMKADSVEMTPLNWGGASVGTNSFKAYDAGSVKKLEVTRLDAVVDRGALLDRHFRIKQITADSVVVSLAALKKEQSAEPVVPAPVPADIPAPVVSDGALGLQPAIPVTKPGEKSNWLKEHLLPLTYSVEDTTIRDLNFTYVDGDRTYSLDHVAVHAVPELGNDEYRISLERGRIVLPFFFLKGGTLEKAIVRYKPDRVSVADCRILLDKRGMINAEGEWEKFDSRWWASAVARDIDCSMFLDEDWIKRLEGTIQATARAQGDRSGLLEVSGNIKLEKAVLTALPVLDTLNAFTLSSKFKRISFDQVSSNFKYVRGAWRLEEMVLVSEGLGQVEGWVEVGADKNLSGQLKIGILPGLLSLIPGAEEKVFTAENNGGKQGYLWANMNLSGTLDNPREDLSARLFAAAKGRLLSSGGVKSVANLLLSGADKVLKGDSPTEGTDNEGKKEDNEDVSKEKKPSIQSELLREASGAAGKLFGL